jgi:hypothetical protein
MVHVGVDLDKRRSQIAVLTEEGEISQQRLPNDPVRLEKFFAELPPHTPVAIEASGTWWWLVDLLEHLGHDPILSHPKQTKAIAAARLKNDRVDAERLALLLSGRSPAHRLDSLGRAAGGARTCSPPRPTRLAARHRPQSAARHARAAQPPAGIHQDLADAARAARTAARAPRRYSESDPRGLQRPAAPARRPDPPPRWRAGRALGP